MAQIFYQQPNARVGDVIPKYVEGTYQLFYLKNWRDRTDPEFVPGWHRMETRDLVQMSREVPVHVMGGTGDLIEKEGVWHLFACIFPNGKQLVTHYISTDGTLDHWELQEEDTFGPDGVVYHGSDWRDPRVVYREDLQEYWMFLAARANKPHSQTGCVGLCVSKDLKKWEYREPIYFPQRFHGACECPDVFRMGDWYYLVFSAYTNLFGTYYVKCPVGGTQWQIPKNHRLDSRAFYAAKTAGTGMERYLFGWNPTKENDEYGFWPQKFHGQDYQTWDWGGSMVIHQLHQLPDGDLAVAMPSQKKEMLAQPLAWSFHPVTEGWSLTHGQAEAVTQASQQMMILGEQPETMYCSVEIRANGADQAGLVLHGEKDMKEGYYLYVEPERGRFVYRSGIRMGEEGGKTFPYDVELESAVRTPEDGVYRLEVLTEGSVGVAYVNQQAALSFRMYDHTGGYMGLFSFGKATFSQISWKGKHV